MSDMSPERWRRIDQLFQAAADLPPAERSAYLDGESIEDPELRSAVEEMLSAISEDLHF